MTTAKRGFGLARPQLDWWAGRAALVFVVVVAGYWLSLATLWRDLGGQTPTAFIGLAPILALGLLLAGLRRRSALPLPGRIDLLLGLILIALAAIIVLVLPGAASVYFWAARLDILSMPLFVAGALILLFGWRVLFVSRGALLVLLLAWPLPYLVLIENSSNALTEATAAAVTAIISVIPIASAVEGPSASFLIAYPPDPFMVEVATACAGMNSTVAFLLVGGAFTLLLNGRILAKLLWLALGLVVVFALNIVRVILVIAVGAAFGKSAAIDMFHPVAGMLALLLALLVMLALVGPFGLRVPPLRPTQSRSGPARQPARIALTQRRHALAGRAVVLVLATFVFAFTNSTFAAYERAPGSPVARPLAPVGQIADRMVWNEETITIGQPYFGEDSTWVRYRLGRDSTAPRAGRYLLWLDNIRVTDRQKLVDFNIDKCYRFHGQPIEASQVVSLGHGVVGRVVQTRFREGGVPWLVVWWEWPVQSGALVEHERIVLMTPAAETPLKVRAAATGTPGIVVDFGTAVEERYRPLADDMAALASDIVAEQLSPTQAAAR